MPGIASLIINIIYIQMKYYISNTQYYFAKNRIIKHVSAFYK